MQVWAYLATITLLVLVPGPDVLYVLNSSLLDGRRAGFSASLGAVTGALIHVTAATLGLSAVIVASQHAFFLLRLAGAAYLVWLGGQALRRAFVRRRGPGTVQPAEPAASPWRSPRNRFRQGFLTDISNPKMLLIFVALTPQFLPADPTAGQTATLGLIFLAIASTWLVCVTTLAGALRGLVSHGPGRRVLDGVTGTVFVGLGAGLALEQR